MAAGALLTGTVAKTPPGNAAVELLWDAGGAEPELEPEPELPDAAAWQVPTGPPKFELTPGLSTELPGFGKRRSFVSTVAQPLPTLATNISGRALKAFWSLSMSRVSLRAMSSSSSLRFAVPAVIPMAAQFMYISRLPTLLNQVQARIAFPVGILDGMGKV